MHSIYESAKQKIQNWARSNQNIKAILIIGSQARLENKGDQWSDLDLLLFAKQPSLLIDDDKWLSHFGKVICITNEIVNIDFIKLIWHVKRPLYEDFCAIDFSIMPFDRLNDVLNINKDIHYAGYQILYTESGSSLESIIEESLIGVSEPQLLEFNEESFNHIINDLLYHIIWSIRKVKRNELWTATQCINCYMKNNFLNLVEMHNSLANRKHNKIIYEGRFLEQRINPEIQKKLKGCFAKYDRKDIIHTLSHLLTTIRYISNDISAVAKVKFNKTLFEDIEHMYKEILKQ
jgi:aminoglycoside 6-adenylyltransferase